MTKREKFVNDATDEVYGIGNGMVTIRRVAWILTCLQAHPSDSLEAVIETAAFLHRDEMSSSSQILYSSDERMDRCLKAAHIAKRNRERNA